MEATHPSNLSESDLPAFSHPMMGLDRIAQWNVYQRLQELSIPCECKSGQPLRVSVDTVLAAIQLWSVIQSLTSLKQTKIDYLERCWQTRRQA